MKVLVTGGAGYIGSVVAARLLEHGHEVVVLDDLSTGHRDAVPDGARFVSGRVHDLGDDGAGRLGGDLAGCDAVVHLAASSLVGESVRAPEKYWRNNVGGAVELLAAMRRAGVRRLVFSSTAAVYGQPRQTPIPEDAPTAPTNPYGATKLAVDHMIAGECAAHGLTAVSLRYFNVAGAHGSLRERHDPETHIVPLALRAAASGTPLSLFGTDYPTPDGTCVRDYIHVVDLADAHLLALSAMAAPTEGGAHRVYNLGNGTGFSVREVVAAVTEVTGRPVPLRTAPRRPGDPPVLVASAERARAELGWSPARPGLAGMIADAWSAAHSVPDEPQEATRR